MPLEGDELPSFSPSILLSNQLDLPNTPADPAAQIPSPNITGFQFDVPDFRFAVPEIDLDGVNADMLGVNDDDAAAAFYAAGGTMEIQHHAAAAGCCAAGGMTESQHHAAAAPCSAAGGTTGIQHLEEEEDAQSSWSVANLERLIREVHPLTAPDEKLAPAPEDGRTSGRDADMPEVNKAAPQPGSLPIAVQGGDACGATTKHLMDEDQRGLCSFQSAIESLQSAIEQDLLIERHNSKGRARDALDVAVSNVQKLSYAVEDLIDAFVVSLSDKIAEDKLKQQDSLNRCVQETEEVKWSIVEFTGPTKVRKPHQPGWKEKTMKGLRAVAYPSSPQPPEPGQQERGQRYVGMKKTLERDDDGNGNKWRAHDYTPLVRSGDGSYVLVPAEFSLRLEFKDDEREDERPAAAAATTSTKRKEDEPPSAPPAFTKRPKTEPKKSAVWERMTKVHVKVATTDTDGNQRKKNPEYKIGYAICHRCDEVFNADSAFPDADMLEVNDAAACCAAGGAAEIHHHACCGTTGIQHLEEEEDAQQRPSDSWSVAEHKHRIGEVDPLTAPNLKLAPAPEDGRTSGRDADMPEVNKAAPQPGPLPVAVQGGDACGAASKHVMDEGQRRLCSLVSAIERDLLTERRKSKGRARDLLDVARPTLGKIVNAVWVAVSNKEGTEVARRMDDLSTLLTELNIVNKEGVQWSTIGFTGPTKERKPHQPDWKEKSMKGLRAVADPSDPSSPQPPEPGQQEQEQRYVGMKKTLEKDDDGNGNKWRAHEYTLLVPSDDGSDILVPAEISLRLEFKVDEREDEQPASATSTKRKEDEPPSAPPAFTKRPKTEPKKSAVWKRMTKVHVKVATTMDGSQRKKPCYKVMFAICHHCDKVFNADSANGTNNLSKHLLDTGCCKDCKCTHSHLR